MTINEQDRIPRPIEELAKLDTYQGMTDEEIELFASYRLEIAVRETTYQAQLELQKQESQAKVEAYAAQTAHANAVLDALVRMPLDLKEV